MQVHGSAEARTHIIIDYNRNGIVNQIALNGSDFKMGFIIAGAGACAGAATSWLGLVLGFGFGFGAWSSESGFVAVAIVGVSRSVAEVTFNAIIYEFIFFAPPNRTLNAVCSGAVSGLGTRVSVSVRGAYCRVCRLGWVCWAALGWGHMQTNGKQTKRAHILWHCADCRAPKYRFRRRLRLQAAVVVVVDRLMSSN